MTKVITTKLIHVVLAKSQHQIKFILKIAKNLSMRKFISYTNKWVQQKT